VLILLAPFFAGAPTMLRALALLATVLGVACVLSVPSHRLIEVPSIRVGNSTCARIARRAHAPAAPSSLAT
jgi:peptidoglycan/LPS O-acetylase OafA/YrhL